ncbi:hypothetical protein FNV43_RR11320 [Rhamnella rubrinervis]|uniref:Glutamate receptor n=1 Tax=Rhamnella rubrinervis TaxID=2594499 RepID=A0A8K0H5K6_9ROSA|nr:hypothetical protein FNV43_RR11320 [Rhamnella rubrinervis]
MFVGTAQNTTIPVKVGVVLDLGTELAQIWLSCIKMALSDFYTSHASYKTRLVLNTRDSKEDVVAAAAAALDLIKNEQVQAILGPQTSMQASFIIELGNQAQVPILSFSATSPFLTSIRSPYFFRIAQNDSSQVKAISAFVQAFGWKEVVPIYVDNDYGQGLIPYLTDALTEVDARIPYRSVISPSATDEQIENELLRLLTMQTRVFIVHMWYNLGSRFFTKAKKIGMMERGYVWIITHGFTDLIGSLNSSAIDSMQGVLGVKSYVPRTKEWWNLRVRWKREYQRDNPNTVDPQLNIMGLWAYDAVFALATAVEKVKVGRSYKTFDFQNRNGSSVNSTDLESFGVSRNGPNLCEALESTRFKGIAGEFELVDGELKSWTFQIVNVIGESEKRVGFWTPENGLTRTLMELTNKTKYSSSTSANKSNLGSIIWPGDSNVIPKGWDIPANEKKLRIGVPMSTGFTDFVKVTRDSVTNEPNVEGFCIDVFKAAVEKLPYALPYDLIPFMKPNGDSAGDYNELIYQVHIGNFDAVVGDTTIRENRSKYVDFTLPYTESGVVMVVPFKDKKSKSAWVFLEPLTWDLWVASTCFFAFIGFVVWVLEHRINEDFRGPPSHQVGTSFWFSFSTMVFANRERVVSNLARFVVIIWVFVVLILTQSYTASLSSILTVRQLQPTVTDLDQLRTNGYTVGYINGSFVYDLLINNGFDKNKIKAFDTAEECDELLSKGTAKGGIAAAIDETPNMKIFHARYCSRYTMIGPIFKTDGFGFAFPRGSPLVGDISRAILNVTEGDEMKKIENKWLMDWASCPLDSKPSITSSSLSLDSFWGLFLIAGVSSLSALVIFAVLFIFKHRHILLQFDSETSIWRRITVMFRTFDQRDMSSHTFRKSEGNGSVDDTARVMGSPTISNFPPSPTIYSGSSSPFYRDQETPRVSPQVAPTIELNTIPNQEINSNL